MNAGWLCASTLKTAARPSPMSTAPAFSPGPCTTRGPSVGSVRRCFLLLLYEQCSDHMTENSPSSVRLGSRPRALTIRPYSSRVRLCWVRTSGLTGIRPDSIRPGSPSASCHPPLGDWEYSLGVMKRGAILVLLLAGCGSGDMGPTPPDPILVGAGDISSGANDGDEATARILDGVFPPGAPAERGLVFTLGDNAYDTGSP